VVVLIHELAAYGEDDVGFQGYDSEAHIMGSPLILAEDATSIMSSWFKSKPVGFLFSSSEDYRFRRSDWLFELIREVLGLVLGEQ